MLFTHFGALVQRAGGHWDPAIPPTQNGWLRIYHMVMSDMHGRSAMIGEIANEVLNHLGDVWAVAQVLPYLKLPRTEET